MKESVKWIRDDYEEEEEDDEINGKKIIKRKKNKVRKVQKIEISDTLNIGSKDKVKTLNLAKSKNLTRKKS